MRNGAERDMEGDFFGRFTRRTCDKLLHSLQVNIKEDYVYEKSVGCLLTLDAAKFSDLFLDTLVSPGFDVLVI